MASRKPFSSIMSATAMSSKIPKTHNFKALAAAAALVLVWITGLSLPRRADGIHLSLTPSSTKPVLPSSPRPEQNYAPVSSSDLVLSPADSDALCSHFHLDTFNTTSPNEGDKPQRRPPRKIYDLLLITPDTSIDALELHLAQMSPSVDFFILLESPSITEFIPHPEAPPEPEWWERDGSNIEAEPSSAPIFSPGPPTEELSLLDRTWESRLYSYHDKIIRRTLSQFSSDFAPGKDHEAAARNAVYTQVVPFLTGMQKAELGDVLLVSDVEEVMKPITLQVLRNCDIPHISTVRTRKYWYSFQWVRMDAFEVAPDTGHARRSDNVAINGPSNEQWSHPQVTIYQGTETIMPNDLRNDRSKDEYVFADGGWTCKLCYRTITETLHKAGEMGLIWHDGPRWKAAGRTVDRVRRGIDLFDQTKLSRIESNIDIPFYLRDNPHRFPWMLDRDPHNANFDDFDEAEFQQYLAKQNDVDAEKDIEEGSSPHVWNLATTQSWNDPEFAPSAESLLESYGLPASYLEALVNGLSQDLPQVQGPEMSEEDKAFLEKAKEDPDSKLTAAELAVLEQLAGGTDFPAYGED
ncbi:hypothetical protein VM1G_06879 [Cytospora mali]|uniref:Beta-1,4-mannosyl-glycoprotein 4-beta-N-acetylglucosaminyltransferase n=1 Tax=Cytospora mali TaxID=578113 RepID=A0A194W4Q4_CYTMA|nr:hypothetical protein VM1G_06879 [Valsa mali]